MQTKEIWSEQKLSTKYWKSIREQFRNYVNIVCKHSRQFAVQQKSAFGVAAAAAWDLITVKSTIYNGRGMNEDIILIKFLNVWWPITLSQFLKIVLNFASKLGVALVRASLAIDWQDN